MKLAACLKIFLLGSLVFVASCGLHDLHSTKTANSNDSGSSSSARANANPLDVITASIQAQLAAKSYRARMESADRGNNTTQTIEYVAPDRYRIVGPMNETVVVGSDTYAKLPTGKWQKIPIDINQAISSFRDPKMIEELRKSTDVKDLGTDTIEGMPMKVYQCTVRNAFGTNLTSTLKVWISAADNLPRKMEVEGDVNGKPSKTVIAYSDYNTDIKIDPPSMLKKS